MTAAIGLVVVALHSVRYAPGNDGDPEDEAAWSLPGPGPR